MTKLFRLALLLILGAPVASAQSWLHDAVSGSAHFWVKLKNGQHFPGYVYTGWQPNAQAVDDEFLREEADDADRMKDDIEDGSVTKTQYIYRTGHHDAQ